MPKRKRRSNSVGRNTNSRSSNPFLKFGPYPSEQEQSSSTDSHHKKNEGENKDPVFTTFLSFMDLSKQKSTNESKSKMNKIVKKLLSFLPPTISGGSDSNTHTTPGSKHQLDASILSAADIVTLLLPWSIKILLRISSSENDTDAGDSEVPWQTLKTCLEFIVVLQPQASKDKITRASTTPVIKASDILTLGTLHKLVPVAIKIALQNNSTAGRQARTCYCILVDQYYMPPFDNICDSLLPLLDRNFDDDSSSDDDDDKAMFQAMLVSTLRLLHKRLEKANPKRSFQKLIAHKVFGILAKIYKCSGDSWHHDPRPVIENLLLHGLFHSEHHMDGFRSIAMKIPNMDAPSKNDPMDVDGDKKEAKSFHCYQEGLLPMISNGLSPSESNTTEEIAAFVGILPILLKCFIRQTLVLKDQLNEKATSKKKASDNLKIVQLQFRFFSVLSAHLINRLETQSEEKEIVDRSIVYLSLEQNLRQLLVHDVYLPTMDDKKEIHFKFLANLASTIVERFTTNNNSERRSMTDDEWKYALSCLNILAQLNHLVLHESLPQILSNCVASTSSSKEARIQIEASKFVTTLVAIYKKLRQLDFFASSFVDAVSLLEKDGRKESLHALNLIIGDAKVKSTLADSIFSSPVNQIKEIFTRLNDCVVNHSGSGNESWSQESSDAVVGFLLLLLQNVRIDINTAGEIYPLCETMINSGVQCTIVADGSMHSPHTQNGLRLFGHAVALINKCEFWIDRTSDKVGEEASRYKIPNQLFQLLDKAAGTMEVEESVRQELLFLACQFVERLHSQIQEKQQVMFATDEAEFTNEKLVATAKKLARFALYMSTSESMDELDVAQQTSSLHALADSVSSWAPYVEKDKMLTFLSNLFFYHLLQDSSNLDGSICVRLLGDSEFFEAKHVTESLGCALVSCTAELTRKALNSSFNVKQFSSTYLTCPISHSSWDRTNAKQLNNILTTSGKGATGTMLNSEEGKAHLEAASKCVGMLKRLPTSIWTESCSCTDSLDLIVRLDLVYRSISEKSTGYHSTLVDILTSLHEISSNILESLSYNFPGTTIGDSSTLRNYMQCITNSARSLMTLAEGKEDSHLKIVNSSKISFCAISKTAMAQSGALEEFAKGLDSILTSTISLNDNHGKLCTVVLCWAVVREIDLTMEPIADLKRLVTSIFEKSRVEFLPIALSSHSSSGTLRNESTRLVGELLKFGAEWVGIEAKKRLEDNVQKAVIKALNSKKVDGGFTYLIGCLALSNPTKSTRISLANGIIKVESTTSHVLETAFSELVVGLDSGSLEGLLEDLASFSSGRVQDAPFRLRLFHLLVVKLAPTRSLPIVAEYSRRFFHMALQCMVKKKNIESDYFDKMVHNAVSLITEMASNRDVISLRESDIALILCHINSAINLLEERSVESFSVTTSIYNSCCSMLMVLLQRFPKQLHSCVSLTGVVLVALLQRALYGDFPEHDAKMRCQKYTRLCELLQPHGDVYKKHVLSILLEFVKAIRGNLDPTRKNDIMPAIFCLLDILQQYENSQLNCMLDDMGRALLRSVHKNYQRAHVYKGQ